MSRYIDADKAKEKLGVVRGAYSCFLEEDRPYYHVLSETIKMINEMPTADVRENVKGEWLPHPNKDFREWDVCSACGVGCKRREYELGIAGMEYMTEYNYPYCPNCGAQMIERIR